MIKMHCLCAQNSKRLNLLYLKENVREKLVGIMGITGVRVK